MLVVLATLAWATTQPSAAESSARAVGNSPEDRVSGARHGCKSAARAIRYYKAATLKWQQQRNAFLGGHALAERVKWPNCRRALKAADEWVARARAARTNFARLLAYHYDWRAWMPEKDQRVVACETGHQGGTGPDGASWTWDSDTYVSAYGIYRSGYNDDAHRIGNLGWDETLSKLHRYPTPREQMEAAESHRAANGGWSGWGCRGA